MRGKHQTHSHTEARGKNPPQVSASDLESDFMSILTKTGFRNKAPRQQNGPLLTGRKGQKAPTLHKSSRGDGLRVTAG